MVRLMIVISLLPQFAFATVFHEIDETQVFSCSFSYPHHNRICVEEGRIRKVICPEGPLEVRLEGETGQAYVQLLDLISEPLTVTVVTDRLKTQDLEITFEPKPCEVLVLQESKIQEELVQTRSFRLVDDLMKGRTPRGYVPRSPPKCSGGICPGIIVRSIKVYEGSRDYLLMLKLKNVMNGTCWLSENQVATRVNRWQIKAGSDRLSSWVYLSEPSIKSGKTVTAIISMEK